MEKKHLSRTVSGSEQQLAGGVCLSLPSFIDKYSSHYFPRLVQIRKGAVRTPQADLSEGTLFTVHAVAKSDMVSMQDDKGAVYAIPIDATSEFGMVFGAGARGGQPAGPPALEFKTAGDLAAALPATPKLVCALKSWTGDDLNGSGRTAIEAGEVLIVVNVSAKHLDLYSLTFLKPKSVPSKCAGRFSTAPSSVKLTPFKLLHYFPDILPVRAVAFPDVYCSELPPELDLQEVTLLQRHEKGSVICSYLRGQDRSVFSFPSTTSPLEVYVMPFYDHKFIEPVYEYSEEKSKSRGPVPATRRGFSATSLMVFPLQAGQEQSHVGSDARPPLTKAPTLSTSDVGTDPDHTYDRPRSRRSLDEGHSNATAPNVGTSANRAHALPKTGSAYHQSIDVPDGERADAATRKANVDFLSSLNEAKLLMLLDNLDLSMYKKAFKKEKVTGSMLSRLDEGVLEKELGVKKQLHRLRLMDVITGKSDIRKYFVE